MGNLSLSVGLRGGEVPLNDDEVEHESDHRRDC